MSAGLLTLAIDASTYGGSVAVLRDAELLASAEVAMRGQEEERLMPAVAATVGEAGVTLEAVQRVVCGEGPGSFTSLRIAGAIAKGIAFARKIPLVPVPSLALLVAAAEPALAAGEYLAVLDALRHESYVATVVVGEGGRVQRIEPMRVVPNGELADLAGGGARLVGPGQGIEAVPHARGVARMTGWLAGRPPAELGSWEPVYGRLAEAQVRWEAAHGRPLERA